MMGLQLITTGKCPVCQKTSEHRLLFRLDRFNVYECKCSHRFIDPSLDENSQKLIYQSSEELRKINPALEHYYEYETLKPDSVTYAQYRKALIEIESRIAGRLLLEVGCGAGSFLSLAQKRGWVATGVDSSFENIEQLRQVGVKGTHSGFLEYQSDEQYDCIALWDLIEHLQDPGTFIKKCWGLLKSGGLLFVATPHYPNMLSVVAELLYWLTGKAIAAPLCKLYMIEHTSYFSRKTLKGFLKRFGFKEIKYWKTETDLDRYSFPPLLKTSLKTFFAIARWTGWQNRINMLAQKC